MASLASACASPVAASRASASAPVVLPQPAPAAAPAPIPLAAPLPEPLRLPAEAPETAMPLVDQNGRPACGNLVFKGTPAVMCDPG